MLPKMSTYSRGFHKMKCMFFVEKNGELLEKYDEILHNVGNTIKKNLIMNLFTMKNI